MIAKRKSLKQLARNTRRLNAVEESLRKLEDTVKYLQSFAPKPQEVSINFTVKDAVEKVKTLPMNELEQFISKEEKRKSILDAVESRMKANEFISINFNVTKAVEIIQEKPAIELGDFVVEAETREPVLKAWEEKIKSLPKVSTDFDEKAVLKMIEEKSVEELVSFISPDEKREPILKAWDQRQVDEKLKDTGSKK